MKNYDYNNWSRDTLVTIGLVAGVLMLVAGIWLDLHYGSAAHLCNSTLGEIGQGLSSSLAKKCQTYTGLHTLGVVLIWLGIPTAGVCGYLEFKHGR